MWFVLPTGAAALMGIALIAYFVIAVAKSTLSYLTADHSSTLVKIHPQKTTSTSGTSVVTEAYYYKPRGKYTANVRCNVLKETKFIVEDSMLKMEKEIGDTFDDFDKRIAKKN